MLTVQSLLDELDLELATGAKGAAAPVRWVHISELQDPTPWLSGGELMLTTGIPLDTEAKQRQFVADLATKIRYYNLRHCVKPGLAGWAQLRYPYGASEEDAAEKLKYDLFYVKNNNLLFDILILIQTFEVVLFGRGVR